MTRQAVTGSRTALQVVLCATFFLLSEPRLFGAELPITKDPRLNNPAASALVLPLPDRSRLQPGPAASIQPSRVQVSRGESATFNAEISGHPNNPVNTQLWTGPGDRKSSGTQFTIDTAKLKPGDYEITLTVTDRSERETVDKALLTVTPPREISGTDAADNVKTTNRRPLARISPAKRQIYPGERARFLSRSFHPDRNGKIIKYTWNTSAGQTATGAGFNVDTRSLSPGTYTITLDVMDQREAHSKARATLEILPARALPPTEVPPVVGNLVEPGTPQRRPIARIAPKQQQVGQGESASFDGRRSTAPEGSLRLWSWRVDDRRLASGEAVNIDTHELAPGNHRVILEVTDNRGVRASDEALLIVIAKQKKSDAAVTELEVLPGEGMTNREVRLKALIANRGEETLRDIKVRFESGGKLIAESSITSLAPAESREARATWIPAVTGEYRITVTLDPDNRLRDSDRSNNTRLRTIQIRPQPAVATIDPSPLEVTQGEEAKFVAKVTEPSGRDSSNNLFHRWRGPGGRVGQDAVFLVNTQDLQPGKYEIALEVTDREGSKARANAILTIKQTRAKVWLTAHNQNPEIGDNVRFSGGSRPSFGDTQYKFIFGDGKESGWLTKPEANYIYENLGSYSVQLIARHSGQNVGQQSAQVTVKDVAYTVALTINRASARAGEPLSFSAAVTPAAGNLEYQFDFGDKQQAPWSPNPNAAHSYARDGTYAPRAAVRIKARRVVQSAAVSVVISPPPTNWWPWFGIGAAMLAISGVAYRRWHHSLVPPTFSVVPVISLNTLKVNTSGKVHSGCDIAIRGTRGDYTHQIEPKGDLIET